MVHAVKDMEDFEDQVQSAGDKLVVVDFHAPWCGPCKIIGPNFEELSNEFDDVVFLKVDCDDCEDVAAKYDVTTIPKFVFLKNKKMVGQMVGTNLKKLKELVIDLK